MELKRKQEIFVETSRRLVVRVPEAAENMPCPFCPQEKPMISAEQAAAVFNISRRVVYRLVEAETGIHFVESRAGILLVCPASLHEFLPVSGPPASFNETVELLEGEK